MVFRSSAPLGLALALGLFGGLACNITAHVALETYGDEAAEDYGCIVGDLGCECLPGDLCDGGLTCVDDACRCVEGPCKEMPPMTTSSDSGTDSGTDSGSDSGTDTGSTSDATDTGSTSESTTDTTDTSSTSDTDTSSGSDSGSDSGTGTT